MRRMVQKREKLNNAGMTLVEIIVAMAILSVAVIPLMFAFVNSARYNARGRELQQTTVLAHTIMENCKAYSMDEIDQQIMTGHNFLQNVSGQAKRTVSSVGNPTETYYYMTGVQVESFTYDIELKLTPRGATPTTFEYDMLATENMNPYLDAIFTVQSSLGVDSDSNDVEGAATLDQQAYLSALNEISEGIKAKAASISTITEEVNLSAEEIESDVATYGFNLYRTITIEAKEDSGVDTVTVTYSYMYELTSDKYVYVYTYPDLSTEPIEWNCIGMKPAGKPVTYTIYNNTITNAIGHECKIENVYFFYYPAYDEAASECVIAADNIIVKNNLSSGRELDLYVLKQKNTVYDSTKLNSLELGYTPALIAEGGTINLYHNYDDNLSGVSTVGSTPTIDTDFVQQSLVGTNKQNLMYSIEVSIYNAGSYDASNKKMKSGSTPMITMDGTALNW